LLNLESITLFSISLQYGHFIPHALVHETVSLWIRQTVSPSNFRLSAFGSSVPLMPNHGDARFGEHAVPIHPHSPIDNKWW
jgi:hypothetical protein